MTSLCMLILRVSEIPIRGVIDTHMSCMTPRECQVYAVYQLFSTQCSCAARNSLMKRAVRACAAWVGGHVSQVRVLSPLGKTDCNWDATGAGGVQQGGGGRQVSQQRVLPRPVHLRQRPPALPGRQHVQRRALLLTPGASPRGGAPPACKSSAALPAVYEVQLQSKRTLTVLCLHDGCACPPCGAEGGSPEAGGTVPLTLPSRACSCQRALPMGSAGGRSAAERSRHRLQQRARNALHWRIPIG